MNSSFSRLLIAFSVAMAVTACNQEDHEVTEFQETHSRYQGTPVWSSDDNFIAGVEANYMKIWNPDGVPLQGPWIETDFQFKLVAKNMSNGDTTYLTDNYMTGRVDDLYYMEPLNYLLFLRSTAEESAYYKLDLNSKSLDKVVVIPPRIEANPNIIELSLVPSPGGDYLAQLSCQIIRIIDEPNGGQRTPQDCELSFIDAFSLNQVGPTSQFQLADSTPWLEPVENQSIVNLETLNWTPDNKVIITDRQSTAYIASPGGIATETTVPTCEGPMTTSSKISATGERAGVKNGELTMVSAMPTAVDTFACQ